MTGFSKGDGQNGAAGTDEEKGRDEPQAELDGGHESRKNQPLLERLAIALERARIGEYVKLTEDPLRLIYLSFLSGMARGLGMIVGFVVLGALALWVLQRIVALNLPGIGRLIAQLIRIVQENMIH